MYLHIGGDYVIDRQDIVGVFDIENSTVSNITREYLKTSEKNGQVITIMDDMPKSFIVINKNNKTYVYLSALAPATLKKRFDGEEKEYGLQTEE